MSIDFSSQQRVAVNFNKIVSMSFTYPLSYRFYKHKEHPVSSWPELYFNILHDLSNNYHDKFDYNSVLNIIPEKEIGDIKASKSMKRPASIRRGIYIETDFKAETILRRIRKFLDVFEIPYDSLQIFYSVDEQQKKEHIARNMEKQHVYVLDWDMNSSYNGSTPISYKYKNKRSKMINSWPDIYVSLLSDLLKDYPKKIKSGVTSEGRHSPDIIKESVKNNMSRPKEIGNNLLIETMGTTSKLIARMYYFIKLCNVDQSQIVIKFSFKDDQTEIQYLKNMPGYQIPSDTRDLNHKIFKRFKLLLQESFENGYRINNKIDYERLCSLYESKYKEELPLDFEAANKTLLSFFPHWGGCVYTQFSNDQKLLLDEVLLLIHDTFDNGATCIYLQSILEKYNEFEKYFNIYTIENLGELLKSQSKNTYWVKRNYLCFGRRKPAPDKEIIDAIRIHQYPITLSELSSYFWYIPYEKIRRIVLSTDSIITVRKEQYFYAPNLSLTTIETDKIVRRIKEYFTLQLQMTEVEFLCIVLEECPLIFENSSFLTLTSFWKSLIYQFKDIIMIEDNYIKAKR